LILACCLLIPPAGFFPSGQLEAAQLRHKGTKFRVKAPDGFRLRASRGIYTIKRRQESVTIMKLRTPVDLRSTAEGLASTAGLKRSRVRKKGPTYHVTGTARGKPVLIELKGRGQVVTVTKFQLPKNRSRARNARALTLRDVAALRRISNSARGGIVSPLSPALPMQPFSQGGASAMVLNLPGWSHFGSLIPGFGGALSGGGVGQGSYALGIAIPLAFYVPADNAISAAWAPFTGSTITDVAFIPGTVGVLGPGFESAYFYFRFTNGGVPYEGVILSAIFFDGVSTYYHYHSYIAVREGLPPGIGQALATTWRTWNPSAGASQRLDLTLRTVRGGTVFDRAHEAWVEYIRR